MMALYTDLVQDAYGRPIPAVDVLVLTQAGQAAALTNAGGTAVLNPTPTDALGRFSFYATDGLYSAEFRYGGVTIREDDLIVGIPPTFVGATGPSNNTRASLAALKAAAVTDKTSLYDGSLWSWTTGDFTGRANDRNIVKSDAFALTVGAWVRNDKTISVRDFGATGLGVVNDRAAIQAAISFVGASGSTSGVLKVPAGTYLIDASLSVPSNVTISGDGAATIIKKTAETVNRAFVNADSVNGNLGIVIESLVVDGARTSTSYVPLKDGIYLTRCKNSIVRNVIVRSCLNDGIIDEYGDGNQIVGCVAESNAKDGFYWTGSDNSIANGNVARTNLVGGFALACTWNLAGSGNTAYKNLTFDVAAGRDSRFCDFGCTINALPTAYGFFTAAESIGAGNVPQTLHGKVYPGDTTIYGTTSCTFRLTGVGKVHLFLSNDNTFELNMSNSGSQGVVAYGSKGNRFNGSIKDWSTGFSGLQMLAATTADGLPASMGTSISSSNNNYGGLRLYDSAGNKTAVTDAGTDNLGFGAQRFASVTDRFYKPDGVWTPVLYGDATAGTPTYTTQTGWYARIGRVVIVHGDLQLSAVGGIAGNVRISGLPFAATSGAAVSVPEFVLSISGGSYTAIGGNVILGAKFINLTQEGSNVAIANVSGANLIATSRFSFDVIYLTDDTA